MTNHFKPLVRDEIPTLGYAAIDWITNNLAMPDRVDYEPFVLYRDQAEFILKWYSLNREGRRRYARGVLSRARGWGKSPLLAALAALEAIGPVRFSHWNDEGRPVARPWSDVRTPLVHIAAVSEKQVQNTWLSLTEMLREEAPVHDYLPGLNPMSTFIDLPRGRIDKVASSARSVKGARAMFAVMDQPLAVDTPIPTPDGWREMGELEQGDWVYGSGGPVQITAAKPIAYDRDCYRLTFEDGTSVVASAEHPWHSKRAGWPARHHARTRTTVEMMDGYQYRIPAAPPQPLPEADLPAHPYLLGLWLGDGTRGKCEITVSENDLPALQEGLAEVGVESWPRRYGGAVNLTFTRARGFGCSERPEPAKAIQSLGCYRDKHIPEDYFAGSIDQRHALIQGLMDADGHATKTGACTFINTNLRLAEGLVRLLRSVGQVTSGAKWVTDDRYTGGGKYRVDFTPRTGLVPFRIPRKRFRVRQHRRGPDWVTITSIEPVDRVPVRCIAVASDDHLFACGVGGHLTHNTEEWVEANGGHHLADVMRSNAAKVGGTVLESPNAFFPGDDSVAERSAHFAEMIKEGRAQDESLLWDHRESPPLLELDDRKSLIEGLRQAYGDASGHKGGCVIHTPACPPGHMDLDRLISVIYDPAQDIQRSRSDFLNQITHHSDAWLTSPQWKACHRPERGLPADGEAITLGFDGSQGRARGKADATALIGVHVSTGHMFQIGVWEQPHGRDGKGWTPPTFLIDNAVRTAFERWRVIGMYADPNGWTEFLSKWEAQFGHRLWLRASGDHPIMVWPAGKTAQVHKYVERTRVAVVGSAQAWSRYDIALREGRQPEPDDIGEFSHDGSDAMTRHFLNARRRKVASGYLVYKAFPESWDKIDAAYAGIMAWTARLDALSKGFARRRKVAKAVII
ncbi:MAG TPA: LAGLIDADG family homing endonuclease [Mycobacterium sp.]|nr:LAGLIDADG family homing endonuclease [Mycobacterium sp.]